MGAFLIYVAVLAGARPAPSHWCPDGWQWDGSHCWTQMKVAARDPVLDLEYELRLARLEAALAYYRALGRAYEAGAFPQSAYGRRGGR